MMISQSSFTNAFGDKATLHRETIDHYLAGPARWMVETLSGGSDARSAFEALAMAAAAGATQIDYPSGCIIALAGAHVRPGLEDHQDMMRAVRRSVLDLMVARLRRGVTDGDLSSDVDVGALADFFEA